MKHDILLRLRLRMPKSRAALALAVFLACAQEPGSETLSVGAQYPINSAVYDSIVTTGDSADAATRNTILNTNSGNVHLVPSTNGGGLVSSGVAAPAYKLDVAKVGDKSILAGGIFLTGLGGFQASFGGNNGWWGNAIELQARAPGNFKIERPDNSAEFLRAGPTAGPDNVAGATATGPLRVSGYLAGCSLPGYAFYALGGAPNIAGCPLPPSGGYDGSCTQCPAGMYFMWVNNFWSDAGASPDLNTAGTLLCCPVGQ